MKSNQIRRTLLKPLVPVALITLLTQFGCAKAPQYFSQVSAQAPNWSSLKQQIRAEFPQVSHTSTEQLADWLTQSDETGPLLLDVRQPEEYEVSHLQGAQRAETFEEAQAILASVPKDQLIVLYCSVGYRSSALAQSLVAEGYTQVYNLEGSLFAWANEGRPVYLGDQPAYQVHPFNAKWGKLLNQELWAE